MLMIEQINTDFLHFTSNLKAIISKKLQNLFY